MEKKSLLDSVRNLSMMIVLFAILLVAFSITSMVSDLSSKVGESITGEVILIKGSEFEENVSIGDGKVASELNDNLICWIEGGLTEEDLIVIGHLLRDIDCPSGEKRNVNAKIEGDCVILDIEDEASTKVCPEGLKPVVEIDLTSGLDKLPEVLPEAPQRNYYIYGLFIITMITVLLFWREYEMGVKTDLESKAEKAYLKRRDEKRKAFKKALEEGKLKQKEKKEKIVYLPSAPIYDTKKAAKKKKEKESLEKKKKKDTEDKAREVAIKRNELITEFNGEAESINKLIVSGKLKDSRKKYLNLFKTYTDLSKIVSERNRNKLDGVMQYLCHYLGALEKIKGTSRKSIAQKILGGDEITIRSQPKLIDMKQLDKMKELIDEKNYTQAKNLFYDGKVDDFSMKNIVRSANNKRERDKLAEIEIRHDRIMKKGVVNVAEEDYYKFMMDMTALRKELKRRGSVRPKKKS
ncbi:hypothetical protein HOF78_02245 [Candidatus Woesearchaeota archaeon]|jgi:hypothetical protein|nr:hypothetical protein [Candidatus Woesearchaeota archaeon]MBT6044865.1 hypothetical protein [Candidatus Woesearchaeota archaeon]